MKRGWFFLLALSIGLNIGLLYNSIVSDRDGRAHLPHPPFIGRGAPPGHPGMGMHCDPSEMVHYRLGRLADRLDLTEEQRAEVRRVLSESMPALIEARDRMQEARQAVHEEYRKAEPDRDRVRELVGELGQAQARLDSIVAETLFLESEILTPEQRAQYLEAMPWEHARKGRPGERRRGQGRP